MNKESLKEKDSETLMNPSTLGDYIAAY